MRNSRERQRRVDIRNKFFVLGNCIPKLKDVKTASKIRILIEAKDLCEALRRWDTKLKKKVLKKKEKNSVLKTKLKWLMNEMDHPKVSSERLNTNTTRRTQHGRNQNI